MTPPALAEAQAVDRFIGSPFRDLLYGEVELLACNEVDRRGGVEALFRLDRDFGADQADLQPRVFVLQRFGDFDIGGEGGRRGVDHRQLVAAGQRQYLIELEPGRRSVDQSAARNQGSRLGQPGRVPERADLALGLVARSGAAVEAVE